MSDHPARLVIAVVDDDQSILRSLEYLLESADYAVRLFTSAPALLDSGSLAEIHCLITDIDMPGMDGFELLGLIHAARPGLPTIVITGYPERAKRTTSATGGDLRVFTKPFHGEELLAAVGESLANTSR